MSIRYVYTISSAHDLVQQAILSIRTLHQFVEKQQITVFMTPPVAEKDVERVRSLAGDIRLVDHYVDPIPKVVGAIPRYYADKLHLCSLDHEEVIFLDADTIVLDDPATLMTDADFRARPGSRADELPYDKKTWAEICGTQTDTYLDWMPNAGVLVFSNGTHREIEPAWRDALRLRTKADSHWTEQHALSVACGGVTTEQLTPEEHVMLFRDEKPADGIIYHLGDKWRKDEADLLRSVLTRVKQLLR